MAKSNQRAIARAVLARLVDRRDLPRLLVGLVRVGLAGEADEIREQAA